MCGTWIVVVSWNGDYHVQWDHQWWSIMYKFFKLKKRYFHLIQVNFSAGICWKLDFCLNFRYLIVKDNLAIQVLFGWAIFWWFEIEINKCVFNRVLFIWLLGQVSWPENFFHQNALIISSWYGPTLQENQMTITLKMLQNVTQ